MAGFPALLVSQVAGADGNGAEIGLVTMTDDRLMPGDVTVRVRHSTINYKDGMALTGNGRIARVLPLIPGIDFAGEVEASDNPAWKPGDTVILNGWGVGEVHHGGLAAKARVKGEWLTRLPAGMSGAEAMAIGTAGYTAMLSLLAIEAHGATPEHGPVLVTGAAGGVGSIAVALLAKAGWHVIASTGRAQEADYLKDLGAQEIIDRASLSGPSKPLGKERWIAAVDSVGSLTLASVLSQTNADGVVAACGLAQGMDLPTTVAPFILRGVTLAGINSVYAKPELRDRAWARLAGDLDRAKLAAMTSTVPLAEAPAVAARILKGEVRGRVVVDIS